MGGRALGRIRATDIVLLARQWAGEAQAGAAKDLRCLRPPNRTVLLGRYSLDGGRTIHLRYRSSGSRCCQAYLGKNRERCLRGLKRLDEFFQSQTRLFDNALERAGLERFMLRNNNRAAVFAKDEVRARLTKLDEAETFQCANCCNAGDVPGNLHATARIGSWEKCRRMRLGRCFGSK